MKKGIKYPVSRIIVKPTAIGRSIEEQLRKASADKEPIQATAKVNYTDRKDGVIGRFNVRFDKFDYAQEQAQKMYADTFAAKELSDKGYTQNKDGVWGKMGEDGTFTPMTPVQGEA